MSYNEDQYFPAGDGRERQDAQPRNAYQDIVSNGIPKIRVMGVGGAGNNAVNRMIEAKIVSAECHWRRIPPCRARALSRLPPAGSSRP